MTVIRPAGMAALVVGALAGFVQGQTVPPNVPPPPPVFPRLATAVSQSHQPAPVPPSMEIEVLDPNVDPRGYPAVMTRSATVITSKGPDGRVLVDIPPTALVHRYYYTGDRSFQAGLLPGGPCIVVVSHPKTGERLYIPVQFPPGAPRVYYTADSITYDYGTQAVTISFCCLLHDQPKVTYRQGVPFVDKVENCATDARDATRRLLNRTGIPDCAEHVASGTKSFVLTTVDRVNDVGEFLIGPPKALLRATPLGTFFVQSPEDLAAHERAAPLQRVQNQAARQGDLFVPSNR